MTTNRAPRVYTPVEIAAAATAVMDVARFRALARLVYPVTLPRSTR